MNELKQKVVIIDYGAGNLFSVKKTVERLGFRAQVSREAEVLLNADRVIFPGVGQASRAMESLRTYGLEQLIPSLKVPVLGICLGMQLLGSYSEEGDTGGLGIFPVEVKKIPAGKHKVPHMGWNRLENLKGPLFRGIKEGTWVYFIHSYYVPLNRDQEALCCYHEPFCAAMRKENFFGCQFHPEKSGTAGEQILRNFLTWENTF